MTYEEQSEDADGYGQASPDADTDEGSTGDSGFDELDELSEADQRRLAKLLDAEAAKLAKAIEDGDAKHPVYKGLQRRLSQKDKVIDGLTSQLQAAIERMQVFEDGLGGADEMLKWLAETTLEAVPEEYRKEAEMKLRERRMTYQESRARQRNAPAPAPQPQSREEPSDEIPEWVKEQQKKFVESRRKAAQRVGLDPADKRIYYGSDPNEPLAMRLEKFEESIEKLLDGDEDRLEGVRMRTEPVPTRNGSGGGAPTFTGGSAMDKLRAGSMKRLQAIQQERSR